MKNKLSLFLIALGLVAMSFKPTGENSNAVVDEQNGVKLFVCSKPTAKYDILGMVKIKGMVSNEKGPHMIELLVEYAKKDYPSGQAIIVNSDFVKAEVIRFKD